MIVDRIENLEKYFALNPLFKEVADFLSANDMSALSTGIHHIKGDDVFVNIQEAAGKTKEQAVVEYHRKMVDIQIPFSGEETYGYIPTADLPQPTSMKKKTWHCCLALPRRASLRASPACSSSSSHKTDTLRSLPMLPCFARPSSRSKHRQTGGCSISFTLFT